MSLSPSNELHLTVTAGSPFAEVFLIDHDFELVQRSVGDLECDVPPGVYKIKTKLADATAERLVLLEESAALDVSGDLAIGSPVPIDRAAPELTRGMRGWPVPSGEVTFEVTDMAEVFLVSRRVSSTDESPAEPPPMSLHRLDGTTIESLEPRAGDLPGEQSTTAKIDPGPYLVRRWDRSGDVLEQCVYAVPGWQTQVFALEEAGEEANEIGRSRVSVLMAQHRFDPHDPQLPLIEEARTALAYERKVATETMGELIEASDNPMLGLFGAHLMLIARDAALQQKEDRATGRLDERAVAAPVQFDQARFNRIVHRLVQVLGPGHPDAVALATQRTDQSLESLQPVVAPPMLWRSWVLLIGASNAMPSLVPVSTWQHTLHVLPLRPFFLWTSTEQHSEVSETWTRNLANGLSGRTSGTDGTTPRVRSFGVDSAEPAEPAAPAPAGDDARRRASEQLLVPRAAIDRLAEGEPL
jgi:hypothetical protein